MVAWLLCRQRHRQTIFGLRPLQVPAIAQQANVGHLAHGLLGERSDHYLSVLRQAQNDSIERVAFGCEPYVFRRVAYLVFVEVTALGFRRAFAVNPPRARAVNGLAVGLYPNRFFLLRSSVKISASVALGILRAALISAV